MSPRGGGARLAHEWDGGWSADAPDPARATVVDSWLVDGGRTRAVRRHLDRFAGSCRALLADADAAHLERFLRAVSSAPPMADGRWFPRIEAHDRPVRFVLWVRPAPAARDVTGLWTPPEPDPRRHPGHKGPDLTVLAELRERARAAGHDDALLWGPAGDVREAAHAALLWWRDGTLVRPPQGPEVLPSITAALVTEIAGGDVRVARCHPDELADTEVWTVNALHGISPVVRIDGRPCRPTDRTRLDRWRRLLDAATEPFHDTQPVIR